MRGKDVTRPGTAVMMTTVRPTPATRTRSSASLGPILGTGTVSRRSGWPSPWSTIARTSGHPQIDFLHQRVGLDLFGQAVGHDPTVVQHGDAIGEREGHVHVVLDDEQRDGWIQALEQRGHHVGLG